MQNEHIYIALIFLKYMKKNASVTEKKKNNIFAKK
jgi:hypothetical protein